MNDAMQDLTGYVAPLPAAVMPLGVIPNQTADLWAELQSLRAEIAALKKRAALRVGDIVVVKDDAEKIERRVESVHNRLAVGWVEVSWPASWPRQDRMRGLFVEELLEYVR